MYEIPTPCLSRSPSATLHVEVAAIKGRLVVFPPILAAPTHVDVTTLVPTARPTLVGGVSETIPVTPGSSDETVLRGRRRVSQVVILGPVTGSLVLGYVGKERSRWWIRFGIRFGGSRSGLVTLPEYRPEGLRGITR